MEDKPSTPTGNRLPAFAWRRRRSLKCVNSGMKSFAQKQEIG
jgi:hypothetical protein